ncbi:14778_t:CDS:10 [Funneliformis caledonium]|uniref:14778_t:CDS:1 n=1 Tax=Funneliformis caledonium TaxID=1117310 RepID=A0A9N9DA73_9GLOM|nr:14778_t:CDS:10 [Funneliformis caledonium]
MIPFGSSKLPCEVPSLKSVMESPATEARIIYVACPSNEVALNLSRGWEGQIEESAEKLLMIKASEGRINEITDYVNKNHGYDVPESDEVDETYLNELRVIFLTIFIISQMYYHFRTVKLYDLEMEECLMSTMDLDMTNSGQLIFDTPSMLKSNDTRDDPPSKTVLQLAFVLPFGTIWFLLFCFLRTRWSAMYAPRSRLSRLKPKTLPNTFFGWIWPLIKIPESDVLNLVGLDAVVLLAFFKMSYKLFAFCGIFALIILSPMKIYNYFPFFGNDDDNNLFDGNPTDPHIPEDDHGPIESQGILVSYVVFTWAFSLATYYFTFYNYREFSAVRHRYYLHWKDTVAARTVMVTVVPRSLQTDRALKEFYSNLNLGPVESAVVYRHVRKLRHVIEQRATQLRKLEEAYVEYLGNPCMDPNYHPDLAVQAFEKALDEDPSTANSKTAEVLAKVNAKRPTIRTGFLGIFGEKVDKIDYYTKSFIHCDQLLKRGRLGSYVSTSIGFVTFKDFTSAQLAAQILIRPEPFQCNTELAPEPRDVFWYNLNIRKREMLVRDVVVNFVIVLLVFFWSGPISFFASLLSLSSLKKVFPWLADLAEKNDFLKSFIQVTIPTLAVISFNALLPMIMQFLSRLQGFHSRSMIEYSTFSKYFFFLLFNVLLVFTIAGTIFNALEDIINNIPGVPLILAKSLSRVSPIFINYVVIQGIAFFPTRLVMIKEIAMAYILRVIFANTPRDFAEGSTPPLMDYGQELAPIVLVFILVLVYSSLTPIILFFGIIYFFFGYICFKYLLLYVYFHPYESSGLSWPKIFRRIMIGVYIFQLLMIGYMSLRKSFHLAVIIMPLLVITGAYSYYVNGAYDRSSRFIPLESIREDQKKLSKVRFDVRSRPSSQGSGKKVAVVDAPVGSSANTSSNLNENNNKLVHSQRDVLEDDLYRAEPDLYTDYIQPPMTLYNGVLNTGMRNYVTPSLVGVLPWLWLPVKRTKQDDMKTYGGFIRRLLGMNKNQQKVSQSEPTDSPSIEHDRQLQQAADVRMNAAIEDAGNGTGAELPGSLSGHGADDIIEQIMEEPEQMITSSEEPSTSAEPESQRKKSKLRKMTDKLGIIAGTNFS